MKLDRREILKLAAGAALTRPVLTGEAAAAVGPVAAAEPEVIKKGKKDEDEDDKKADKKDKK